MPNANSGWAAGWPKIALGVGSLLAGVWVGDSGLLWADVFSSVLLAVGGFFVVAGLFGK